MIRQSISCDICAREMRNPNHWFVVCERGAELRVIRWGSRARLRADARHLCGQTCLHKLVDEFMARAASERAAPAHANTPPEHKSTSIHAAQATDTALTSSAAHSTTTAPIHLPETYLDVCESSARLIVPVAPTPHPEPAAPPLAFVPRASHTEAWNREREREREREQNPRADRRSIA